jgi:hypothetical protein
MRRILIAGVLAGLAMFAWEAVTHMLLPFGEMGLSTLPDDEAVRQALAAQLGGSEGLYFYPDMTMDAQPSAGAWGLVLYHPQMSFNYGAMFGWELLTELVQGLALALVIGLSATVAFGRRMTIALLVGIAAAVCVSPSYTIWFGYPLAYTLGQMIVALGDYLVGGAVIAAMLGRSPAVAAAT